MKHLKAMSSSGVGRKQTRNTRVRDEPIDPVNSTYSQINLINTLDDMTELIRNTQPQLFKGEGNNVADLIVKCLDEIAKRVEVGKIARDLLNSYFKQRLNS